jgi:hypothetical protein
MGPNALDGQMPTATKLDSWGHERVTTQHPHLHTHPPLITPNCFTSSAVCHTLLFITQVDDPVVILGFGPQGQMVANMLSSPLAAAGHQAYIAFDLEPSRVDASRQAGFLVQYGDGSRSDVLKAAGERGTWVGPVSECGSE